MFTESGERMLSDVYCGVRLTAEISRDVFVSDYEGLDGGGTPTTAEIARTAREQLVMALLRDGYDVTLLPVEEAALCRS